MIYAIIPAAGLSSRLSSSIPKQYLPLNGKPILEWTLNRLLTITDLQVAKVMLAEDDTSFGALSIANHPKVQTLKGGATRFDSVYRGFAALELEGLDDQDWILVHDAARPCLHQDDLNNLIETLKDHPIGGILAEPVRDTLKKVNSKHQILRTVEREKLWQAQTPQLFRAHWFRQAMNHCKETGFIPTDEAAAIERIGLFPMVVESKHINLKVTYERDLKIAEVVCCLE